MLLGYFIACGQTAFLNIVPERLIIVSGIPLFVLLGSKFLIKKMQQTKMEE